MKDLTIITIKEDSITDYAAVRNRELAKVKSGWVLFLDTDEELSPGLEKEISRAILSGKYPAYAIPRLDTFLGRELGSGEAGTNRPVRLAKRDWGQWVRPVHEVWQGEGRVGHLNHPILHHPHTNIGSFLEKINHYSNLESQYRHSLGIRSSLLHLTLYPLGKFVVNYVFKLGFLDAVPGFIHAVMMSFHSYLTWGKLYLLWRKN